MYNLISANLTKMRKSLCFCVKAFVLKFILPLRFFTVFLTLYFILWK